MEEGERESECAIGIDPVEVIPNPRFLVIHLLGRGGIQILLFDFQIDSNFCKKKIEREREREEERDRNLGSSTAEIAADFGSISKGRDLARGGWSVGSEGFFVELGLSRKCCRSRIPTS